MKFVELLISSGNKKEISNEITTKDLTEKEVAGLQYLGGYVLRKVFMKIKLGKTSEFSKQAMELLMLGKTSEKKSTFVEDLSRDGGLWSITDEMEKVFLITERYYSIQTASTGLREINIPKLVDNLLNFPPLFLTYEQMAMDHCATIDKKVIINTLASLLRLFLTVRTFSLTKDIVSKKKQKIMSEKALRKSIKAASRNEDTK